MKEVFSISKRCRERFFTQTATGVHTLGLHGLVAGGLSELVSPYSISRTDSVMHVVLFTLAGEGRLESPGPTQVLRPGSVCVLPAGYAHSYQTKRLWRLLWFHLSAAEPWSRFAPGRAMVFNSSWANQLVLLAQEFLEESTRRGHLEHHQLMEGYARLMALFLQRVLSHFQSTGADEHRRQLQTIWGNVSQNPGRHWNVANLAVTAHLSRSHFQARVQAICGCGVMEMVTRLRMERATGLLLQQHLKLAEIAGRVGYDSPFSFSRAFKRVFGVAPDDYRRRRLSRA